MISGFSDFLNNKILNLLFGNQDFEIPSKFWIGLLSQLPSEVSANGEEVEFSGYTRKEVRNNTTNFPITSTGIKINGIAFEFAPAEEDWEGIIGIGIFDDPEVGHLWGFAEFPEAVNVNEGDILRIPAGLFSLGFVSLGTLPKTTEFLYNQNTHVFSWKAVNLATSYLLQYSPVGEEDWVEVSDANILVYNWQPPEGEWVFQLIAKNGNFMSKPVELEITID